MAKYNKKNSLAFTDINLLKDVFIVVIKFILSFLSLSIFMFANALYSLGMGITRIVASKMHGQDVSNKVKSYRQIGTIISIASLCYTIYSVRLFFGGTVRMYPMWLALLIAFYTFSLMGINMRDIFKFRKNRSLEEKALRAISLSSTLLCFPLTQTAIMTAVNQANSNFESALSGVFFGSLGVILGLFIIKESCLFNERKKQYEEKKKKDRP